VTTPAGAKEIDVTHKSVMVTLKGQQTVDEFNSGKVCGFEDWALDTAKDVSGKVCGDDGKTLDAPVFDIFDVVVSSLKFGEKDFDHDGTIAAKRPVALSAKEEVFTKQ
jgi:archaellin